MMNSLIISNQMMFQITSIGLVFMSNFYSGLVFTPRLVQNEGVEFFFMNNMKRSQFQIGINV